MTTSTMTTHDVERTDRVMVIKHPDSVSIGISNPPGLSVWMDWKPCDEHVHAVAALLDYLTTMRSLRPEGEVA